MCLQPFPSDPFGSLEPMGFGGFGGGMSMTWVHFQSYYRLKIFIVARVLAVWVEEISAQFHNLPSMWMAEKEQ